MPLALLAMVANILHMVEQTGHWPIVLVRGCTALVPKEGPPGHSATRDNPVGRFRSNYSPMKGWLTIAHTLH